MAKSYEELTMTDKMMRIMKPRTRKFTTVAEMIKLLKKRYGTPSPLGDYFSASISSILYTKWCEFKLTRSPVGVRGGFGYRIWRNPPSRKKAGEIILDMLYNLAPEAMYYDTIQSALSLSYFPEGKIEVSAGYALVPLLHEKLITQRPSGSLNYVLSPAEWLARTEATT